MEDNLLLSLMDAETMRLLRLRFISEPDGLDCAAFLCTLLDHLNPRPSWLGDLELAVFALELFRQVDVNGDGNMDWGEFTGFIVEQAKAHGMGIDNGTCGEVYRRVSGRQPYLAGKAAMRTLDYMGGVVDRVFAIDEESDVLRFFVTPGGDGRLRAPSTLRHNTGFTPHRVLAAHFVESLDLLITASEERGTGGKCYLSSFKLGALKMALVQRVPTPTGQQVLQWSEGAQMLFTGGAGGNSPILAWELPVLTRVRSLVWHTARVHSLVEVNGRLVSGSQDGTIVEWNPRTFEPERKLVAHDYGVRQLANCDALGPLFVSVGFGKVVEPHTLHALVWDLGTMRSKGRVRHRLVGHGAPLISVAIQPQACRPHVVTGDRGGSFRVWDARSLCCTHTFSVPGGNGARMHAFALLGPPPGTAQHERGDPLAVPRGARCTAVVACGAEVEHLHVYELQRVAREKPAVKRVLYNATMRTFVTMSANSVRIWDAASGALVREYGADLLLNADPAGPAGEGRGNTLSALSTCCLDFRERKLIVGSTNGKISVHNYVNGSKMKDLDPHGDGEEGLSVTSLQYCESERCVLSTSWGGQLHINDENDPTGYSRSSRSSVLLRTAELLADDEQGEGAPATRRPRRPSAPPSANPDVTCCAYSSHLNLVATGCHGGTADAERRSALWIWDFEFARLLGACCLPCPEQEETEVTALAFAGKFPVLVSADSAGRIVLWAMPPARRRFRPLLVLTNAAPPENTRYGEDSRKPAGVTSLICAPDSLFPECATRDGLLLFCADDSGMVTRYLIRSSLLRSLGIEAAPSARKPSYLGRRILHTVARGTDFAREFRQACAANATPAPATSGDYDVLRWQAHGDAVLCAELVSERPSHALLTGSADGSSRVWSLEGELLGELGKDSSSLPWRFNVDLESRRREREDEARAVLLEATAKRGSGRAPGVPPKGSESPVTRTPRSLSQARPPRSVPLSNARRALAVLAPVSYALNDPSKCSEDGSSDGGSSYCSGDELDGDFWEGGGKRTQRSDSLSRLLLELQVAGEQFDARRKDESATDVKKRRRRRLTTRTRPSGMAVLRAIKPDPGSRLEELHASLDKDRHLRRQRRLGGGSAPSSTHSPARRSKDPLLEARLFSTLRRPLTSDRRRQTTPRGDGTATAVRSSPFSVLSSTLRPRPGPHRFAQEGAALSLSELSGGGTRINPQQVNSLASRRPNVPKEGLLRLSSSLSKLDKGSRFETPEMGGQ